MLMLALRLILKEKGGKQHCLQFVGSKLGVEIFLKKREHQKRMRWNRGLRHLCILFIKVSRRFYAKPVCFLIVFGYKRNSKSFIFFHYLIIEFLWFAYGSNSRKRYTPRLLSNWSVSSKLHPTGYNIPPQPFDYLFHSLRWAPFSLALHLCSS